MFDERDNAKLLKLNQKGLFQKFKDGTAASIIGFWMNNEIKIGNVSDLKGVDYVFSTRKLNLTLIFFLNLFSIPFDF